VTNQRRLSDRLYSELIKSSLYNGVLEITTRASSPKVLVRASASFIGLPSSVISHYSPHLTELHGCNTA
jgi:hypothetical protein